MSKVSNSESGVKNTNVSTPFPADLIYLLDLFRRSKNVQYNPSRAAVCLAFLKESLLKQLREDSELLEKYEAFLKIEGLSSSLQLELLQHTPVPDKKTPAASPTNKKAAA